MKSSVRFELILALSLWVLPWPAIAQDGVKACALLTRDEVASAGVSVTARGLMPDEPVVLKKGSLPGIVTDMRMDQCTTEMAAGYAAFPARWSVASTKEALDKKAWDKMNESLSEGEKKEPDPAQKAYSQAPSREDAARPACPRVDLRNAGDSTRSTPPDRRPCRPAPD